MPLSLSLVADIGATHARFQLCDLVSWAPDSVSEPVLLGEPLVLNTKDFSHESALYSVVHEYFAVSELAGILFAVAGPVAGDGHSVTVLNTGLNLTDAMAASVFAAPVFFANDFVAQATAVPFARDPVALGGPEQVMGAGWNKAVIGPGSGLGMATLVAMQDGYKVLASEGGHAGLAPGNHLEAELWGLLAQAHQHVCWETVLSGSGLVHLYKAMCGLWGSQPEAYGPLEVAERGMAIADPICHQTLETFCGLLGSCAGSLALTVGARGGVYIGGGLVPNWQSFLDGSPLRRRFDEQGDLSEYVRAIPLWLMTDPTPGLVGAMHLLAAQLAAVRRAD